MKYEPTENFRTGGLRETPLWRWSLYVVFLAIAVGFLGKFNHSLFYAIPIGAFCVVLMFSGMAKTFNTPHIRTWMLDNLWWIIPIFILTQVVLFLWDRNETKLKTVQPGDTPNTHSPSAQGVGGR